MTKGKETGKKLQLNKETIAQLTSDQTRMVAGGGSNFQSCNSYAGCSTVCTSQNGNCPSINTCVETTCITDGFCQPP
jgi:hypothetical protein